MSKKYFAYIRVSTIKQGERGSSLAEQKSAIEAYVARHDLKIARWFEETETAAKRGRRLFSAMLAELKQGRVDGLIMHKIDRGTRNWHDWASLGDLIDRGVDVRFVTDNLDLMSRGGRLTADIQAVVAADYIRNLREEVKKGMYGRLKQGLYPWSAPMGYLNNGKAKLKTIDPVKGPLVRYLFERYSSNTIGFEELRREMWEKGLRTSVGKPLFPNTLTAILNNPFYMGVIRIGTTGETFPGAHEPLISKALYDRVQTILRGKTVPKAKKHRFLLRQMVRCEHCSTRHLTGEYQKSRVYYRCHGKDCQGVPWRGDVLENIALEQVRRVRFDFQGHGDVGTKIDPWGAGGLGDFRDVAEEINREREGDRQKIRETLHLRLKLLDDRMTRLTDLLIDETIDRETFNFRKEQLLMERQGLVEELAAADQRSPVQTIFEKFERNNRELLRYEILSDDEKRELIDIVCSNFTVRGKSSTFALRSPYKEIAEDDDPHYCAPTWIRTRDHLLKREPLYRLSYGRFIARYN